MGEVALVPILATFQRSVVPKLFPTLWTDVPEMSLFTWNIDLSERSQESWLIKEAPQKEIRGFGIFVKIKDLPVVSAI